MEKTQPPPQKQQSGPPLMPPIGSCGYRVISTKDNQALRPVCANPRLNTGGRGWGSNSCYDIRFDKNECPFVEEE